ncbi:MAG: GNAT family N-acetyltransferase [Iodobacter sp.]
MIYLYPAISELAADEWNHLAGPEPLVSHAYLSALESTGAVAEESGWQPCHLGIRNDDGELTGVMPLYRKTHSYGEYVFDRAWAEAYHRHALQYYPKLICAIPFTPVTGPRLLAKEAGTRTLLVNAACAVAAESGDSSFHLLFAREEQTRLATDAGLLARQDVQFHWQRGDWRDWADFSDALTRDKRKKLRQDRRKVTDAGVVTERKRGKDISEADWAFFYRCYANTYFEHRSSPYLSLAFFLQIARTMPEACLLIIARQDGHPIAAALNIIGPDRLYGRYWGADWGPAGFVPNLHFELCFYQGIEYALEAGLSAFEGGAQGAHKLARGFMPVTTQSAHWLAHPGFADAIDQHLARERVAVTHWQSDLIQHQPFKTEL